MPRYTVRCIFCGAKNTKRSPKARTFKCQNPECGEVNFGPGMGRVFAKMVELSTPPGRAAKVQKATPAAVAVAGQTTVIKAAKSVTPPTPAKPAPRTPPPTPAAAKSEPEKKRSWIYG